MMNLIELADKIRPHRLTSRNVMFNDVTPLREAADVIEEHEKLIEIARRAVAYNNTSELFDFLEKHNAQ